MSKVCVFKIVLKDTQAFLLNHGFVSVIKKGRARLEFQHLSIK